MPQGGYPIPPAELVVGPFGGELLKIMLENKGKVFTRQMLLDRIWGIDAYVEERIVDSHLKNLRKKLSGSYIKTIRGVGYRIDVEK